MKVKALRDKDTKEFVHIESFGENRKLMVFNGELPVVQPVSATIEMMKSIYPLTEGMDSFDNFELVEFDLIESGEVGADIRNKLTPYKNLVALVELFLDEENILKKKKLKKFIRKEILQSKKSVKYLAGLL